MRAVHVVVPAHDEQDRVARCVRALDAAVDALLLGSPEVAVSTTLVLDACTDRTLHEALAATSSRPWQLVHVDDRCVGSARHRGITHALARTATSGLASGLASGLEDTWLATTDADSEVSPTWLLDHLRLAREHDLVVGSVRPDPTELSAEVLARWEDRHRDGDLHVHGANLGIRASTYLALGGFAAVAVHEDVLLVEAAREAGVRWTRGSVVTTSARVDGRAPAGFAAYIRELEETA